MINIKKCKILFWTVSNWIRTFCTTSLKAETKLLVVCFIGQTWCLGCEKVPVCVLRFWREYIFAHYLKRVSAGYIKGVLFAGYLFETKNL